MNMITGVSINLVIPHLRPDLIFGGLNEKNISSSDKTSNTVRIYQLVFHESAHYLYASKAGSYFWAQLFASEISNNILIGDSYSDGSKPSYTAAKRIALVEGWATFCEIKITSSIYNKAYLAYILDDENNRRGKMYESKDEIIGFIENFNVYDRPMSAGNLDNKHWFMHGIMWDLLDNYNDIRLEISGRYNDDGATMINYIDASYNLGLSNINDVSPIFNRLDRTVEAPIELKNALISEYPLKEPEITTLFDSYGY